MYILKNFVTFIGTNSYSRCLSKLFTYMTLGTRHLVVTVLIGFLTVIFDFQGALANLPIRCSALNYTTNIAHQPEIPQSLTEFEKYLTDPITRDNSPFLFSILEKPEAVPSIYGKLPDQNHPEVEVSNVIQLIGNDSKEGPEGYFILTRKGNTWASKFSSEPYATHGSPIWPIQILGPDLAAFLGIRMISETQMIVPNEALLNRRIEKLNQKLMDKNLPPVNVRAIVPSQNPSAFSHSEMYLRTLYNGKIYVNQVIHDISFHLVPELLTSSEFWRPFNQRASVLFRFFEYWKDKEFPKHNGDESGIKAEEVDYYRELIFRSLFNFLTLERDELSAVITLNSTALTETNLDNITKLQKNYNFRLTRGIGPIEVDINNPIVKDVFHSILLRYSAILIPNQDLNRKAFLSDDDLEDLIILFHLAYLASAKPEGIKVINASLYNTLLLLVNTFVRDPQNTRFLEEPLQKPHLEMNASENLPFNKLGRRLKELQSAVEGEF